VDRKDQYENPDNRVVNPVVRATAEIIRPRFLRWLTGKDKGSCDVGNDSSEVVPFAKIVNQSDSAAITAGIDDYRQRIARAKHHQRNIENSRQRCIEEEQAASARLKRAVVLQQTARQRLTVRAERWSARCKPDVLHESYRNFEMQVAMLQKKQLMAAESLAVLEQQEQQVSVQIKTLSTRLQQLESTLADTDDFQQAA